MRWAARLAALVAAQTPHAKSAKSADSRFKEPIGTFGAIGIEQSDAAGAKSSSVPRVTFDLKEKLAEAMAAKSGHRIIGEDGISYFRSEAFRRLATHDPLVPALMASARLRPSTWSDPSALPPRECRCAACGGRRWWCTAKAGWSCEACHPSGHLLNIEVKRIET